MLYSCTGMATVGFKGLTQHIHNSVHCCTVGRAVDTALKFSHITFSLGNSRKQLGEQI